MNERRRKPFSGDILGGTNIGNESSGRSTTAPKRFGERKPFQRENKFSSNPRRQPGNFQRTNNFGDKPQARRDDDYSPYKPAARSEYPRREGGARQGGGYGRSSFGRQGGSFNRDSAPRTSGGYNRSSSAGASSSYSPRPSFGGGRPTTVWSSSSRGRGGFTSGAARSRFQRGRPTKRLDVTMFVNKAAEKTAEELYIPKNKFSDFKIDEKLKKNITFRKFDTTTPIQDQSIPLLLEGKDVVGLASTGTGKTGAFLIPLIDKVLKNRNQKILIIAPTRELAQQIEEEFKAFSRGLGMWSQLIIGGSSMQRQIYGLRHNNNFIIGTPGRLKDLITQGYIRPAMFQNLVLDEVDRMLDMGFIDDIRFIVDQMPKERQTLFFSATVSREIEGMINSFLRNPVKISIKSRATSENVEQDIVRVPSGKTKIQVLEDLLAKEDFKKVLIFGRTKRGVERLADDLNNKGFKVESIHGDKTQYNRKKALELFKQDRVDILIATDVAARGLDIKDVTHVINYDQPENYDDYIHRIGRTGRANKRGVALTFVD